jgi:hypothetical protein
MPIQVSVNQNPISISVTPQLGSTLVNSSYLSNNVTVGNAIPSVDLSNYATIPYVDNTSGDLHNQILNINGAGVVSLNSKSGILFLNGLSGIGIYNSGQTIHIYNSQLNSSTNLSGYITTGQSDLRYYSITNPSQFINSGNITGTYSTISYVNFISGELFNQIQGGGGSGVLFLNSLAGAINLFSSSDDLSFTNSGQFININKKPQNLIFYRNELGSITGVQKNTEFVRIYKNIDDKITGIYYNNYYKKVLLDNNNNITGVNVIYT